MTFTILVEHLLKIRYPWEVIYSYALCPHLYIISWLNIPNHSTFFLYNCCLSFQHHQQRKNTVVDAFKSCMKLLSSDFTITIELTPVKPWMHWALSARATTYYMVEENWRKNSSCRGTCEIKTQEQHAKTTPTPSI